MATAEGNIKVWGNGLAVRLTKPMATAAGVAEDTPVRITAEPGRIVIEANIDLTLDDMLRAFDPLRHSGEVMAFPPLGKEVI